MRYVMLICASLLIVAGCTLVPHKAVVTPEVTPARTVSGGNAEVTLDVVDERPGTMVGTRAAAGAEIRLAEVTPLVEPRVKEALIANEFRPADRKATADRKLKVEIRAVEMKFAGGMWSAGHFPRAALKAVATNKGQVFERFYRAETESRAILVGQEEAINQMLSQVISKALTDLVNDPELMGFLAR